MSRSAVALLVLALSTLTPSPARAAPSVSARRPANNRAVTGTQFGSLSPFITAVLKSTKSPGLAVAVARHGHIVWEHGFGWAVPERRIAATPHTMFGLASISKSITGSELMVLSSRGLIGLDSPVNRYLQWAKVRSPWWNPAEATVRRVAMHTSGLTSFDSICYDDEPDCDRSLPDAIRRHAILFWKPGTRFDYSNLGFGILGELIGEVRHRPFVTAVTDDFLAPLGIRECATDWSPAVAPHYQDGARAPRQIALAEGASGLACSADSLARLGMFMLKDKAERDRGPGASFVDRLLARSVPADDPKLRYSMGWWINPDQNGYRMVYASGGTLNSGALLYIFPSADVAIAVLGNGGNPKLSDVADQIAAKLLPGYAARLAKTISQEGEAPPHASAPDPRLASLAGIWSGAIDTWRGPRPVRFVIHADGSSMASINHASLKKERDARVYRDGFVLGAHGNVDTPETNRRRPYRIGFELYSDGTGGLRGAATIWQDPGARNGGVFSYPVHLKRVSRSVRAH
jgi:CubicO group peptidase (beta-lactamase class C family)